MKSVIIEISKKQNISAIKKNMKTKKEVAKKSIGVVKKKVATKKVIAKVAASKTKAVSVKKVAVKSKPSAKKVSRISSSKKAKTISAAKKVTQVKKVGRNSLTLVKRFVYMGFSIILGLLIGTFVQLFLELIYMRRMMSVTNDLRVNYFMGMPTYLPVIVQQFFLLAGLAFGIWLGFWGWRFVYIERRHRSTRLS